MRTRQPIITPDVDAFAVPVFAIRAATMYVAANRWIGAFVAFRIIGPERAAGCAVDSGHLAERRAGEQDTVHRQWRGFPQVGVWAFDGE